MTSQATEFSPPRDPYQYFIFILYQCFQLTGFQLFAKLLDCSCALSLSSNARVCFQIVTVRELRVNPVRFCSLRHCLTWYVLQKVNSALLSNKLPIILVLSLPLCFYDLCCNTMFPAWMLGDRQRCTLWDLWKLWYRLPRADRPSSSLI